MERWNRTIAGYFATRVATRRTQILPAKNFM
jgi:hypothetical protein